MNGSSRLGALMAFPPSLQRNLACGPCFVRCALNPEEAGCILEKGAIFGIGVRRAKAVLSSGGNTLRRLSFFVMVLAYMRIAA